STVPGGTAKRDLFPAGFLVAGRALPRMGLFPFGDGLVLVVVHLLVHAHAVLADDRVTGAALVVGDALIDPFDVVGIDRLGERRIAGGERGGKREGKDCKLHQVLPWIERRRYLSAPGRGDKSQMVVAHPDWLVARMSVSDIRVP